MDLNTINTPSELLNQNNTPVDPVQHIIDEHVTKQLTCEQVMKLTMECVNLLGNFHQNVGEKYIREGEVERGVTWMKDEQKLHTVWDILNNIEICYITTTQCVFLTHCVFTC